MIHDACVEVTCDGDNCTESVLIDLAWVYSSFFANESSGHYSSDDRKIETKLINKYGWLVSNGEHFCTSECANIEE